MAMASPECVDIQNSDASTQPRKPTPSPPLLTPIRRGLARTMAQREPMQQLNQSVEERRALRGHYRELAAETLAGKENLVNGGSALQQLLHKADALASHAVRPRERAVDAEVFAQLAQCGLQMIMQGQAANEGRRPADLVRALRSVFVSDPAVSAGHRELAEGDFDWGSLGAAASGLFRGAAGVGCMQGPLGARAKVRKPLVRQAKRPAASLESVIRPEELQQIQENDKQETDRNLEAMWRALKQRVGFGEHVSLIALVCSHASFAQTVENIFTLSFLVRDQRVQLLSSPERGLAVSPVDPSAARRGAGAPPCRPQQFMLTFTMADWQAMTQLVDPSECIMPDRSSRGAGGGDGGAAADAAQGGSKQRGAAAKRARQG